MKYRLVPGESVADGIKRIACEQLDHVIENLSPPFDDHETAVHEARKSLKKLRALLRLVGDEIGEEHYADDNLIFRDAARRLSGMRDAAVLLRSLEGLREEKGGGKLDSSFELAGNILRDSPQGSRDEERHEEMEGIMEEVARNLLRMRRKVERWPIARDDFRALKGGLKGVYRSGRKKFAEVLDEASGENLHEWRKQVKYLWYQTRLLRSLWPPVLEALADELEEVAEALGEDHDLMLLQGALAGGSGDAAAELKPILQLIEKRRGKLQGRAIARGARIFSEQPKAFVVRLEDYWKAWRRGSK